MFAGEAGERGDDATLEGFRKRTREVGDGLADTGVTACVRGGDLPLFEIHLAR